MIKIFKSLRRKLVFKSKKVQYLKYATGEVFLIVIGILIALTINNWNEKQKTKIQTFKYLTNLTEALKDDITSIELNYSMNKHRLNGIFYLLKHANLNTETFTEFEWIDFTENDSLNFSWKGPFPNKINRKYTNLAFSILGRGFGGITLNKSVINELYSTGSFSNIENHRLKTLLGNYYSYLAQRLEGYAIEEHEEWANETTRFLRDKYGIFTLDVADLEDPIALIRDQKDVEHHLRYLALEVNYHCVWGAIAKNKALELVTLINEEEQKLKN